MPRSQRVVNLIRNEAPPCPGLLKPLPVILLSNPAIVEDSTFMECFVKDDPVPIPVPSSPVKSPNNSQESQKSFVGSQETVSTEFGTCSVENSEFADPASGYDSPSVSQSQRSAEEAAEYEPAIMTLRPILECRRLELDERLELMGCTVEDLELVCLFNFLFSKIFS